MKKIIIICIIGCISLFLYSISCAVATYDGREADSSWRKLAAERIEKYRKGNFAIVVTDGGVPVKGAIINVHMVRHTFSFGSAVTPWHLMADSENGRRYRDKVGKLFNKVVLENELKWDEWEKSKTTKPGSYHNLDQTFAALQWLKERNIPVRGHFVSWGPIEKTPMYLKHKQEPMIFRQLLFDHINEKIPTVGGLVTEWDVLNHPVGWGLTLEKLFGQQIYVDILRQTRKLNSTAKLYINETGILPSRKNSPKLRNDYEKLIRSLRAQGAPLDGIGFMGHFDNETLTPPDELLRTLDRFANIGLPLQITEFDVRFGKQKEDYKLSDEESQLQADYTRDFMTAMFSHPAVEGIVMWGFWEGKHWYPSAALYRKDWTIKPNGKVWEDLVLRQWWTNEYGTTDGKGRFATRGFLGDYVVKVNYKGKKEVVKHFRLNLSGTTLRVAIE